MKNLITLLLVLAFSPTAYAQISIINKDNSCPSNQRLISLEEAEYHAKNSGLCSRLPYWGIVRIADGGSMDGSGYGCKIRRHNSRVLNESICIDSDLSDSHLSLEESQKNLFGVYGRMKRSKDSFDYYEKNSLFDCSAKDSWVNTPSLPTDPVGTGKLDIICKFHRFAWQSFAFLVAPGSTQKSRFLEMMPKKRIFKQHPDAWDFSGDKKLVLSNILQAGTNAPLNDWDRHPIFYQQSVNSIFYNDIVSNQLNNSQCIAKIDSGAHQFDISSGSIEIKTSWKILTSNDDASKFFIIHRDILLDSRTYKNTPLALLGIHVVRKTPKHPEWIWATFEHKDNAPDCDNINSDDNDAKSTLHNPNFYQATNKYFPGNDTK